MPPIDFKREQQQKKQKFKRKQKPLPIAPGTIPKAAVRKGRKAAPKAVARAKQAQVQRAKERPRVRVRRKQAQSVRFISQARQRALTQEKKQREDKGIVSDVLDVAKDVPKVLSKTAADIYHESSAEELGLTSPTEAAVALFPGGKGAKAVQSAGKAAAGLAKKVFATKKPPVPQASKTAGKLEKAVKAPVQKRKAQLERKAKRQEAKAKEIKRGPAQARRERRRVVKARKARTRATGLTKEGQKFRAQQRAITAGKLAAGGATGAAAVPLVATGGERTVKATVEEPGKVLGTTARVAPAIATSIAALPADVGAAVIKGETGPLKGQIEGQKEFLKILGTIVGEDEKKAIKAIQEDVGLIPALSAGLTTFGIGRLGGVPKPRVKSVRRQRLQREIQTAPTRAARERARKKLEKGTPLERVGRKRQAAREKRVEAQEAARVRDVGEAQFARETGVKVGTRRERAKRGGRPRLQADLEKLARQPIEGTDLSVAELAAVVGDEIGLLPKGKAPSRALVLSTVAQARKKLEKPTRDVADVPTRRDALDALEKNPELAADPRLQRFLRDKQKLERGRILEEAELQGISPSVLGERRRGARELAQAQTEGVPTVPERVPLEIARRGTTKVEPKLGVAATTALRKEIRQKRQQARKFKQQAQVARREAREAARTAKLKTVRRTTAEAAARRRNAALRRADQLEERADTLSAEAQFNENVLGRRGRAVSLEKRALKAEREGSLDAAEQLRSDAQQTLARQQVADDALAREVARDVAVRRKVTGKGEPVFFSQTDAALRSPGGDTTFPQAFPKRTKRRLGVLARQGRTNEAASTMLETLLKTRVAIEMRKHAQRFIRRAGREVEGQSIRDGSAWARLIEDGKVNPKTTAFIRIQEFERAFKGNLWNEATGQIDDAFLAAMREAKPQPGTKYLAVSKAALDEFRAQMEPWNKAQGVGRILGRVQSVALLGLSPAWFAFQLVASPMAAAARDRKSVV